MIRREINVLVEFTLSVGLTISAKMAFWCCLPLLAWAPRCALELLNSKMGLDRWCSHSQADDRTWEKMLRDPSLHRGVRCRVKLETMTLLF